MQTHHINKVEIDFNFERKEQENALQMVKQLFYEKALVQLNKSFDEITANVYLDKLDIEIGSTNQDNFQDDFLKALNKSLESFVSQNENRSEVQGKHSGEFSIEHLTYFLQKGYWQWNVQQKSEKEIFSLLKSFFKDDTKVSLLLSGLQLKNLPAAERLVNLVWASNSLKDALIRGLIKQHTAFESVSFLQSVQWKEKKFIANNFHYYLILQLLVSPPLKTLTDVHSFFKQLANARHFPSLPSGEIQKLSKVNDEQMTVRLLEKFYLTLQKEWDDKIIVQKTTPKRFKENDSGTVVAPINSDSSVSFEQQYPAQKPLEKIHILNAGLVLFHPFFVPLFSDFNWINEENKFVDLKAQQKAILFLQFITNGKSRQAEHALVLNKILCNWPIHLPLYTSCNFSLKEKQAAIELLESLKEYWSVLKNTSLRGLIESFVLRPGVIQKNASGFLLQVERKTIDILMDSLPFGINTIKLPWNEDIIYTEW